MNIIDKFAINEKKFSIFISSTFNDLEHHRSLLIDYIVKRGHFPIGMELFHASSIHNIGYIGNKIVECDIFVLISGTRYGEPVEGYDKSFTHIEYDIATENNKPILYFVCDESDVKSIDRNSNLSKFRETIYDKDRFVSTFQMGDPSSLERAFGSALNSQVQLLNKTDGAGWIRADRFDSLRRLRHLTSDQSVSPIFNEIIDRLNEFDVLTKRSTKNPIQKQLAAKYFWSRF